ncbi:DUF1002 domain-containing protein [Mesobacillus maritimus]|uniref:DUF1002 domain-containing protein n=1 Tax=Mesobacillus maritimus TaxID=1643336 RepID=UPI0020402CD2|nr:DUF1002 domain-containing protein [Mesobacillus maritimus]MCM3671364.1 DUF1002 domain-containing protein [Mesobacillus maritimus]
MKKNIMKLFILLLLLLAFSSPAFADVSVGDQIITLGENLTEEQKEQILSELGSTENTQIITVSNEEEVNYLGDLLPRATIGTRAISSSSITYTEAESGLDVSTNNINWVTDEMYLNALITAGVKDANIEVTAPFTVSGTAALTGLMKAYEVSSGEVIPEEVKEAANEEMIQTAKLGDQIGAENASALFTKIKESIAKNPPQTDAELREIILQAAEDLGLTLTDEQIQILMDVFNKLKKLDIDWNQVGDQINQAKDKISKYLESEEGQNLLERMKQFFISLFEALKSLFS